MILYPLMFLWIGTQRNIENANKYIKDYADLFKKYGIELIISDKQFPHYFPEWT